jgi:YD repeat-containing protein
MNRMKASLLLGAAACAVGAAGAAAAETIGYSYDAQGRLIQVARTGTASDGYTNYAYDKADNRLAKTDGTGAAPPPPTPPSAPPPPPPASPPSSPPPPSLSIGDASATEGAVLTFTVTKSGSGAASASWMTGDGTATAGSDFTAASGTIAFTAAETSKTVSITTLADSLAEATETMVVNLVNPATGTAIGDGSGTGTILNPAANSPPTTVNDGMSLERCTSDTLNVIANDSDPDGNLPLSLVSVSEGTKGTATAVSATTIAYEAGSRTGTDVLTYVVQDALGVTATGSITISITPGTCEVAP